MTSSAVSETQEAQVVEIIPVHPSKLDLVWATIEPWLEKSMEHGVRLYTSMDVLEMCLKKEFILWVAVSQEKVIAFAVTSLDKYPQMTVATIRWSGSEPHAGKLWLDAMLQEIKRWGAAFGAVKVLGGGRKGWLRGYDFRENGILFEADIP